MHFHGCSYVFLWLFKSCSCLKWRKQHVMSKPGANDSDSCVISSPHSSPAVRTCSPKWPLLPAHLNTEAHSPAANLCQSIVKQPILGRLQILEQSVFLAYSGNLLLRQYKALWLLPEIMSGLPLLLLREISYKPWWGTVIVLGLFLLWSSVKC